MQLRKFAIFLFSILLPLGIKASKVSEHIPKAIEDALLALSEDPNVTIDVANNKLIPIKRFVRSDKGAEAAALETIIDQQHLSKLSQGMAVMLLAQRGALEKFLLRAKKQLPNANFLHYDDLSQGVFLTKEAMAQKAEHIFNAVLIKDGILAFVPHMEWDSKADTYIPRLVKGHKSMKGSPINNDMLELSFIALMIDKTLRSIHKTPKKSYLSPIGRILLMPVGDDKIEVEIAPKNYILEVQNLISKHIKNLENYRTGKNQSNTSEHRNSIVNMSKTRKLIMYNLRRQNDLSLVPLPPTPQQKAKLKELGYGSLHQLASLEIDSETFEEVSLASNIKPKKLLNYVLRARAWSMPPFNTMSEAELDFFSRAEIRVYNIGDFARFNPSIIVKEPILSKDLRFPEIDGLTKPPRRLSIQQQQESKKELKNELIMAYAEEFQISKKEATKRINILLMKAKSSPSFVVSKRYKLPNSKHHWFLDIEDFQEKTYLIGVSKSQEAKSFEYFVAHKDAELDKKPWGDFLRSFKKAMRKGETPLVHIYSPHELTLFTKFLEAERELYNSKNKMFFEAAKENRNGFTYTDIIGRKYGVVVNNKEALAKHGLKTIKKLYESFHDLLPYFRNNLQAPSHSNSLKFIAPYLYDLGIGKTNWTDREASGLNSIAWFRDYLKTGDKKILARIIRYNAVDVLVMPGLLKVLKQFETTEIDPAIEKWHPNVYDKELLNKIRSLEIRITKNKSMLSSLQLLHDLSNLLKLEKMTLSNFIDLINVFDRTELYDTKNSIKNDKRRNKKKRDLVIEKLEAEYLDKKRGLFLDMLTSSLGKKPSPEGNESFARLMKFGYRITPKKVLLIGFLNELNKKHPEISITDAYHDGLRAKYIQRADKLIKKNSYNFTTNSFVNMNFPETSKLIEALTKVYHNTVNIYGTKTKKNPKERSKTLFCKNHFST